jgi:hypothetical protein
LSVTFTSIDVVSGGGGNGDGFSYNNGGGNTPTGEIGGGGQPPTLTIESSVGGCIIFRLTTNNDGGAGAGGLSNNAGFAGTINCVTPPPNDNPCGALPMSAFSTCNPTGVSNVGATNTTSVANPTTCFGYGGSDVWYTVTVPSDGNISFQSTAGTITDGVLAAYTTSDGTCSGTFSQISCNDDCPSPGSLLPCMSVSNVALAGQTIWIRVYEYGGNFEGTFNVCAIGNVGTCIPTVSDCDGAIPLCNNAPVSGLYNGQGCRADLNAANDGCLGGEHNTAWYFIQISDPGIDTTWGFEGVFDVNQNWIEYDWALWGPFTGYPGTATSPCGSLGSPIRCSYASQAGKSEVGIGMENGQANQTAEDGSPSGDGFTEWIEPGGLNPTDGAQAGDVYILMIDRWSNIGNNYNLTFSGSASMDCIVLVLPVELGSFTGERKERTNVLNWEAISQINNDYFTVERSSNGQNWEAMGIVEGAGTTQEIINYSYLDENPFNGVTYYRLRQTDFDGKDRLSHTISIVSTIVADGLFTELFPNPTNGAFYFNYAGKDFNSAIEITILNSAGQLIKVDSFENYSKNQSISIDTDNLSNGVYQILLKQNDKTEVRRISILR